MGTGIFITGTNTEVGKTFVARTLIRGFMSRGLDVAPVKPVESGACLENGRLIPADATALIAASGRDWGIERACAFCFEETASNL